MADKTQQLIAAVTKNDYHLTEKLLIEGAEPNASSYGETALHTAARVGNEQIVDLLVAYGADQSLQNHHHNTPYHLAALKGHVKVLETLDDKPINSPNRFGNTPAMLAAANGHNHSLEYLVAHGADLSIANSLGETARSAAVKNGFPETEKLLSAHEKHTKNPRSFVEQVNSRTEQSNISR